MPFSDFDDEAEAIPTKPQFASDQTKQMADGTYEVELRAGVKKEGESDIFVFAGTVLSDGPFRGWVLEKTIFFNKKSGTPEEKKEHRSGKIGELKSDLSTLGFDVANWTKANNRPFADQLERACKLMKGLRVKMTKRTKDNFVNVYINKRLPDPNDKPEKFGAAEMAAVAGDLGDGGMDVNASHADAPSSNGTHGMPHDASAPTAPGDEIIPF